MDSLPHRIPIHYPPFPHEYLMSAAELWEGNEYPSFPHCHGSLKKQYRGERSNRGSLEHVPIIYMKLSGYIAIDRDK